MPKLPILALLCGLIVVSCCVYVLLGVHLILSGSPHPDPPLELIGNATEDKLISLRALLKPNPTQPPVRGAIRHYKSLRDNQPVNLTCTSCAVVSSSGFLTGRGAGKEIDGQSCVIRLNMAPVRGYEQDVGTRTTLRVMNFFMFRVKADKLPPESRLMVWGLFRRTSHLEKAMNLSKRLGSGVTIHGQSPEGEFEAEELFAKETGLHPRKTKSWISTGWFAMMIALDICQQIHVYGMVPSDYCARKPKKDVPYHYYERPLVKECSTYNQAEKDERGNHRFISEKAVFAKWAQRYNITFHHPSWSGSHDKHLFSDSGHVGWLESFIKWIQT